MAAATPDPGRSSGRLDGVDGLRGLTIFFVLMNHVSMRLRIAGVPYTKGLPEQLVSALVWNGQRGVQIFFALSGFLIASTAIRRGARPVDPCGRRLYGCSGGGADWLAGSALDDSHIQTGTTQL